jgi:glycosyltransferase involved in cell wall biosynthesis
VIAFDLQAVQSVGNSERGIARFVTEIARHLVAGPHDARIDLFLWNDRLPWTERLADLDLGDRLRSFSDVAALDVDVLHVNSPFEVPNSADQFPPVRARRIVTTCYDLIPYLFPDRYLTDRYASGAYRRRLSLIATSDAVVTDSRSAADDVIEHLDVDPKRVTVIGAGVSPAFRPPTEPLEQRLAALRREWPGLSARYVLVPTAADWRKNSIGAIEAFGALPDEVRLRHQLVLFCRLTDHQRTELERAAHLAGVGDRVLFTGYVPDDLLISLYQSAELVFVPTIYEGFGLPVLEARRCGARVICSDTSSLPEVLVDVDARFNPFEAESVVGALHRALVDVDHVAALTKVPDPGFGWDLAVDRMVGVYDRLLAELPARSPSHLDDRPLRVGVVGAMFPAVETEVVTLRDEIIAPLAADDRFDVTAFSVIHLRGALFGAPRPVRPFPELADAWESGRLDAVVYVYGTAPHRMLSAANHAMPGHVVVMSGAGAPVDPGRALSVTRLDQTDDAIAQLTTSLLRRVAVAST